jgi:glycosyltransferase involved in cell wall biosynthesis
MKKLKVGFLLNLSYSWMGEVNYIKSILYSIKKYESNSISPIIFFPKNINPNLRKEFEELAEVKTTSLLSKGTICYIIWRASRKLFKTDLFVEIVLRDFKIDIFSHSTLIRLWDAKTINWIPDFQHIRLPQMFNKNEIALRNKSIKILLNKSDRIILSSNDAQKDLNENFGIEYNQKIDVIEFVSIVERYTKNKENDFEYLQSKYEISKNYFLLPNQFWKHKNHLIVFEALSILHKKRLNISLVCTGLLDDYRNKDYSLSILNYIKETGINVTMLGLINYQDLILLIKSSIAVINPSLFEGWSTIVEECKTLGKNLIISDIPIHREQNPEHVIFFNPYQANKLADTLESVFNDKNKYISLYDEDQYYYYNNQRQKKFILKYKNTLFKTINK